MKLFSNRRYQQLQQDSKFDSNFRLFLLRLSWILLTHSDCELIKIVVLFKVSPAYQQFIGAATSEVYGVTIHRLFLSIPMLALNSLETFPEQGKRFFKMEVNEANLGQLAVYLQQTLSPQAEVNGQEHVTFVAFFEIKSRCENLLRTSSLLLKQTKTTLSSFSPFSTVRLGNLISR